MKLIKYLPLIAMLACTKTLENKSMKNLNIHIPKVSVSLDPQNMNDLFSMMINMQVYRGLLGFDSSGEVIPSIAKSWDKTEDGLKYTFHLGDEVFSDGTPIKAKHVVNTFARAYRMKAEITGDLGYILGIQKFSLTKNVDDLGIKAISDKEVQFTLSRRSNVFLKQIASVDLSILPLETPTSNLENSKKIYSGPYKVESISEEEINIKLWKKNAPESPQSIKFFKIDRSKAIETAKQQQTDYLGFESISPEQMDELTKSGWNRFLNAVTMERFLILNPEKVSKDTRKEFVSLVNQKEIVKLTGNKLLLPAWGAIPDVYPGHLIEEEFREVIPLIQSPKKIKNIDLEFHKNDSIAVELVKAIQASFEKIGVKVNGVPLDTPDYYEHFFNRKGSILLAAKGIDYPDGYSNLAYFSSQPKINYLHTDSSKINKMLMDVVSSKDSKQMIIDYKNIQKIAIKELTFIPISFGSGFAGLWSKKIKFVPSHPMGIQTLPFESIVMK